MISKFFKANHCIFSPLYRYCSSLLFDVQIVPDIDDQQQQDTDLVPSTNTQPSTRKSSTESMDSVILVQTPKHLKYRQVVAAAARYSHHHHHHFQQQQQQVRHQQEILRRIQSMSSTSSSSSSSPPNTVALRRVSRSTPSLTESDLEAYARSIHRSIVPL